MRWSVGASTYDRMGHHSAHQEHGNHTKPNDERGAGHVLPVRPSAQSKDNAAQGKHHKKHSAHVQRIAIVSDTTSATCELLLDLRRFGPGCFQVIPQFDQRIELAVGVGQKAGVFGGGHVAGQGYAVRDAVLQGDHDGSPARRGLFAGEG